MSIERKTRQDLQKTLFEIPPDWKSEWWGMPEFVMDDASPAYRIVVNFMTREDVKEFADTSGIPVTSRSNSCWFPPQKPLNGSVFFSGPKSDSRYPVCIPSKGRAGLQKTGKALDELGVSYLFFVEETESDEYCESLGQEKVWTMPFHDLGQGSIPARNYIWDWAREREVKRHWVVDDNISSFTRCNANRRLVVRGGMFFQAMEDFVDRYENVAMAGPHDKGFCPDRSPNVTPFLLNRRIYSCILIDTQLDYRWRGRYNEDTDLSLRVLKDGYCTVLFRAFLMDKGVTAGAKGKPLAGGNTDNVYIDDDHRLRFAESLRDQHPDYVKVVWKFNRWHHHVDYSQFSSNKLVLKDSIVPTGSNNEYGMELTANQSNDSVKDDNGQLIANAADLDKSKKAAIDAWITKLDTLVKELREL